MPIFKQVKKAAKLLSYVTNNTPIMTSRTLNSLTGAKQVIIKCENFQRTGSF
ncbi:MAG: pyridoxal-5'-phosphate-dependent protein, partial [Candidatus Lokiarchaeota archaeon]|nr:pyridoxal-5'-phosphate-dependent protein [Candidatus Lokiarchaeota archaeon]